ncbi:hypothetical protein GJ496_008793 [Pomphorhynchus laevis]|nr:hypothetical protein GJ496_008793 [Pomphorhynchus laevis]
MELFLYDCAYGHLIFEIIDRNGLSQLACSDVLSCKLEKIKQILWLREVLYFENNVESSIAILSESLTKPLMQWLQNLSNDTTKISQAIQLYVYNKDLYDKILEIFPLFICTIPPFITRLNRLIRLHLEDFLLVSKEELGKTLNETINGFTKQRLRVNTEVDDLRIIQAVSLLDSLNNELDSHVEEIKATYNLHYPELNNIITNDIDYCKFITIVGDRRNAGQNAPILVSTFGVDVEHLVRQSCQLRTGRPLDLDDVSTQSMLDSAEQVVETCEYRNQLKDFLHTQMTKTAPNLTHLVGESVGSRLISRAGSLEALSKMSSSEIQMAGAEGSLALAKNSNLATPKHGYIFESPIFSKVLPKQRGRLARTLASKIALASRIDAMGQSKEVTVGAKYLSALESRFLQNGTNKICRLNEVVEAAKLYTLNSSDRLMLKRMNIEYDDPAVQSYMSATVNRGRKVYKR